MPETRPPVTDLYRILGLVERDPYLNANAGPTKAEHAEGQSGLAHFIPEKRGDEGVSMTGRAPLPFFVQREGPPSAPLHHLPLIERTGQAWPVLVLDVRDSAEEEI